MLEIVSTDALGEATVRDEITAHSMCHAPVDVGERAAVVRWGADEPGGSGGASEAVESSEVGVVAGELIFDSIKPVAFQIMGKNALKVLGKRAIGTVKRREISGFARKNSKICFLCIVVVVVVDEAWVDVCGGNGFGEFIPGADDVEVEFWGGVVVEGW